MLLDPHGSSSLRPPASGRRATACRRRRSARGRTHLADGQRDPPGARCRAQTAPRPGAARGPRPDRHARRLRHEPVRRLHRPRRWQGDEVVHDAGGPGGRRRRHDDRGHGRRRRPAPAPERVLGEARPAVRLLHAGHDHDRGRPAGPQPGPDRRRDPARASKATSAAVPATRTSSRRSARPPSALRDGAAAPAGA